MIDIANVFVGNKSMSPLLRQSRRTGTSDYSFSFCSLVPRVVVGLLPHFSCLSQAASKQIKEPS